MTNVLIVSAVAIEALVVGFWIGVYMVEWKARRALRPDRLIPMLEVSQTWHGATGRPRFAMGQHEAEALRGAWERWSEA
jgi:hypothetical protein